jgi:hypothetical protein
VGADESFGLQVFHRPWAFARVPENRGVPGSSPGLAIAEILQIGAPAALDEVQL